jgi:hypothetical protein
MKTKDKLINELDFILMTTKLFNKEHKAIYIINEYIKNTNEKLVDKLKSDILYEIWKFYRVFKMKEFIFLFKDRIKSEINRIDSPSNKTIEMLDEAFLWYITNWSNDSIRKYEQRFYSSKALDFQITEECYYKLSKEKRNILIDLINKYYNTNYDYLKRNKKVDNQAIDDLILNKLKNHNVTIKSLISDLCEPFQIENIKSLIHAIANQADSKLQLDHVLNRSTIKYYIENLCNRMNDNVNDKIHEIDMAVDLILPFMFGSVVTKSENEKLKSNIEIDSKNLKNTIWEAYYSKEIKVYDFDNPPKKNSNWNLISTKSEYMLIEIVNPYDVISLSSSIWSWNNEKYEWQKDKV